MAPIFSTRAQTQHPCGQLERNRDERVASLLLMYSAVSVTVQVNRMSAYRDIHSRHGRRLSHIVRLLLCL